MLADAGAGRFGSEAQRGRELAIVDLRVFGAEHRSGELARQMRLAPPRLGRGNPLKRQPEFLLEHKLMAQPCLVVRGQGDDQCPLTPQVYVDARDLQQLRGESGPARLAFAT